MNSAQDVRNRDLEYIREALRAEWPLLAGSRVLMTGGAGFLGHYMIQALTHLNGSAPAADRIAVTVWDNFSRGLPGRLAALNEQRALALRKYDLRWPLPADLEDFD